MITRAVSPTLKHHGATLKRLSIFVSLLALSTFFGESAGFDPVRAQEAKITTPEPANKPGRYSLGAGLGFNAVGDAYASTAGALAGLGALASSPSRAPFGTSLLEVAATPKWRFVLGVSGSYTRRISDDEAPSPSGGAKTAWIFSGSVGFRCVLNPGAVVEVSPLFTVGAFRSLSEGLVSGSTIPSGGTEPVYTLRDAMTLGYDARVGLVLEHALLSNLYLRFETYFLRASYTKSAIRDTPAPGDDKCKCRRDIGLAYGLAPVLQLRLAF